ncbi:WGR domain-containing protein [Bradyrhizobium sp.]|uniref:WGR domain-containing protein n=1 Tax=Bradyrhizobium sp. TaxID=376 RepID=UPI002DDDAE7E|nr:WGR domain-containing protein [Bradyrhizobium sp.]HEV2160437.1 WGR domain-containing protein [Bradyrhizobium sp.]
MSTQPTSNVTDPHSSRIGTNVQTMGQTFDGSAEAVKAFRRLERAKRRRGHDAADGERSCSLSGIVALSVMPALSVPRP